MIENLLDILFPKTCLNSGKYGKNYLCSSCFDKMDLRFKIFPISKKSYNFLIYLGKYKEEIRKRLLEFKFYNKAYINEYFLEFLIKDKNICDFLNKFDIIIPVPMHKDKKLRRGYNQTEIFAKNLSKKLNVGYEDDVLIKFKENKTQSLLLPNDRTKNVKDVFRIKNSFKLKNKNIILVDDIFTTGATVNVCSSLLKKSGASEIIILVIAKSH